MQRMLQRFEPPCIWHVVAGVRRNGPHDGLCGDVSGLRGDVTDLWGDASGLRGDIDDCALTDDERAAGVAVADLVRPA